MPLTRYQIRNEYGLADQELYRAAEKDDPEALLEGVAMAGLVGVLRQLGDLAEFAAEIFHNLHEEVMATAARGHSLMARVQQLEAEFPSIEKALLSQTNHTSFFSSTGVDWHPNLNCEQNLIARGDLPRFVMDSYEECRGPPRLFLLDKFDVAGAGACLKRYTDPSFFKAESASSRIVMAESQRERKTRRLKKKGSRWKNGETPENAPTSHVKLHQLLLEERIENGYNDSSCLVKLKKRQLNGCGVDSRNGKSYMEKLWKTPSPEQKMVCDASVAPLSLQLTSDFTCESGVRILEISTASPSARKSPGRESTCSSVARQEVLEPSVNGFTGRDIVEVPEPIADVETEEIPPIVHKMVVENELLVDREGQTESSVDGYHSDDVTSEVDNYMDALATMDSEIETDNEYRSKNDVCFMNVGKQETESDANEEHVDVQEHFSDPQSFGNSSISDDGNSSFKKDRSSFSCSDTGSSSVESVLSDSDAAAKAFPSMPTTCMVDNADSPSNPLPLITDSRETRADEHESSHNTYVDGGKIRNGMTSSAYFLDSDRAPENSDPEASWSMALTEGPGLDKTPSDHVNIDSKTSASMTDLGDFKVVNHDIPSQITDYTYHLVTSESCAVNGADPDVIRDALLHSSTVLELAAEKKIVDECDDELLQRDYQDEKCSESIVIDSTYTSSPTQEQLFASTLPEEESRSGLGLATDNIPASLDRSSYVNSNSFSTKNDNIIETEVKSEDLSQIVDCPQIHHSLTKEPLSNIRDGVTQLDAGSAELVAFYSEEKSNIEEVLSASGDGGKNRLKCNLGVVGADYALDGQTSVDPNDSGHDLHVNPEDFAIKTDAADDVTMSTSAIPTHVELPSSRDVGHDDYLNFADMASETIVAEDVAVSLAESSAFIELPSKNQDNPVHEDQLNLDDEIPSKNPDNPSHEDQVNLGDELPAKNPDDPVHEDQVNLDDVPTLVVQEDVNVSVATVPKTDVVFPSLDDISSPSRNIEAVQEIDSSFSDQYQNQFEINEAVSLEGLTEPEPEKTLGQLDVASTHLDTTCESVLYDHPNVKLDSASSPTLAAQTEGKLSVDHVSTSTTSSKLRDLVFEPKSPHQSDLSQDQWDVLSSPPPCLPDPGTLAIPTLGLPANQLDMECLRAGEAISNPSDLHQSEKTCSSLYHMGDKKYEEVQSSNPVDHEGYLDSSLKSSLENLPIQPSQAKLSDISAIEELNSLNRPMDPIQSVLPNFVPLPEEMPPLPPLPPMQWRLGRIQQAFPAAQEKLVEVSEDPFPSILPSETDQNSKFGSQISEGGNFEPRNPFLFPAAGDDEKSRHISGLTVDNLLQPGSSSLRFPTMFNYLALEGTQSFNPFVTIPAVPNEKPEHGFLTSRGDIIPNDLNPFSPVPIFEDSTYKNDNALSVRKSFQPLNEPLEKGLDSEIIQQNPQILEVERRNALSSSPQSIFMEGEQSQHNLPILDRELALSSNVYSMITTFEVGKSSGNPGVKLPRPRNPLMDAVAAHGKSKLRKATDRILPQIGPKVEERDSLLEQIRTKSFNLKPAVTTRPTIHQGPKTNLKVAAILEKANSIRHALAGSDEDDDSNSWSDSE